MWAGVGVVFEGETKAVGLVCVCSMTLSLVLNAISISFDILSCVELFIFWDILPHLFSLPFFFMLEERRGNQDWKHNLLRGILAAFNRP